MVRIAFYKAYKGHISDWLLGIVTFSRYSHVEIEVDGFCYSSSMRDDGVRKKQIDLSTNKWDVYELDITNITPILRFYKKTDKCIYDLKGAILTQVFKKKISYDISKWFCSEWIITALNKTYYMPHLKNYTSIKRLRKIIKRIV